MELIPILSLIILVATISTFILAVGAYILYKARERKGLVSEAAQPAAIPAELLTPAPMVVEQKYAQPRRTYTEEQFPTRETGVEYQRQPTFVQTTEKQPDMQPSYVSPQTSSYTESRYQRASTETGEGSQRKYMRYTQEGYIEPSKEAKRKKDEDKLRWR